MVKNAWYAAAACDDVRDQPQEVTIHGRNLVIWRSAMGEVCTVDATCPHRGCDLALGSVELNQLVCAYHGWRFNTDGKCAHIPANRQNLEIPSAYRVRSYPTCEKSGLIWVQTGDPRKPGVQPFVLPFPELEPSNEYRGIPFFTRWQANLGRVVESVLDVSHLPFVHPETTGEDVDPVVYGPEYHCTDDDRLVMFPSPFAPSHPMEPAPEDWQGTTEERRTVIELKFPNHWIIRTPVGESDWMCTYLTFTPVDDTTTDIYGLALRNLEPDNEFLDTFHIEHTTFVMAQDQRIVESLRPLVAPFELKRECHVASDSPTIRYRLLLKQALAAESS